MDSKMAIEGVEAETVVEDHGIAGENTAARRGLRGRAARRIPECLREQGSRPPPWGRAGLAVEDAALCRNYPPVVTPVSG